MNAMQKKIAARAATISALSQILEELAAVQFGDASFAVLQNVEGQEIWTEISVKAKAFTPTKTSPEFDPFVAAEEWKTDKEIKAKEKAEKAKEKAAKIARDEARRAAKSNAESEEEGE